MSDYYLASDLIDDRIFISKMVQAKGSQPYLIEFLDMGSAQNFLKKLQAKLVRDPELSPQSYKLVEKIFLNLGKNLKGEVWIYRYLSGTGQFGSR